MSRRKNRQRKREAQDADKVEVAPRVTVGNLMFQSCVDWTDPRTSEAALAALKGEVLEP